MNHIFVFPWHCSSLINQKGFFCILHKTLPSISVQFIHVLAMSLANRKPFDRNSSSTQGTWPPELLSMTPCVNKLSPASGNEEKAAHFISPDRSFPPFNTVYISSVRSPFRWKHMFHLGDLCKLRKGLNVNHSKESFVNEIWKWSKGNDIIWNWAHPVSCVCIITEKKS